MQEGVKKLNEKELLEIIGKGECHTTEFKKSTTDITKDVYESICAFSNRDGGHVFLGVKDNGEILGIEPNCIEKMKKDFVTAINNANKMYPPLFLTPVEYELQDEVHPFPIPEIPYLQNKFPAFLHIIYTQVLHYL